MSISGYIKNFKDYSADTYNNFALGLSAKSITTGSFTAKEISLAKGELNAKFTFMGSAVSADTFAKRFFAVIGTILLYTVTGFTLALCDVARSASKNQALQHLSQKRLAVLKKVGTGAAAATAMAGIAFATSYFLSAEAKTSNPISNPILNGNATNSSDLNSDVSNTTTPIVVTPIVEEQEVSNARQMFAEAVEKINKDGWLSKILNGISNIER